MSALRFSLAELPERFTSKIRVDETGCWTWAAYTENGYGRYWNGEHTRPAHRFSYEALVGPVPDGLELDHLCRNRACVNPEHLEAVTRRTNALRGIGPTAINARKTHCHRGHPFDEENTYVQPDGRRMCRLCHRARSDRAKARAILTLVNATPKDPGEDREARTVPAQESALGHGLILEIKRLRALLADNHINPDTGERA